MDQLVLSFLGSFAVRLSGRPLKALGTDKTRALLAYLVLEPPQAHARRQLAALLWPEVTEPQARQSLRTALYRLRHSLDHRGISLESEVPLSQHVLTLTPQTVQWHPTDTPIVVSCDAINAASRVVLAVPCTTYCLGRRLYPSQVLLHAPDGSLTADSVALGEQVRALAKSRLGRQRGMLSAEALAELDRALLIALDLPGQG